MIGRRGKVKAFLSGIYSRSAYHAMRGCLEAMAPDVVHVHNLYPFFSPSVLVACRQARIPVILHYHNHHLTCPITFHFREGKICERCVGGKEHWCVLKNCRNNHLESVGYALRSAFARKLNLFADNVTVFLAASNFMKQRLIEAGFCEERILVVPFASTSSQCSANEPVDRVGQYVVYVGRLSPEKGVGTLIAAARQLPYVKFLLAGDGPSRAELEESAPANVKFLGWLNSAELSDLYKNARIAVMPCILLEPFGLVITDAMENGLPVIVSAIAGPAEIVDHGRTGLHFEPGNPDDLANAIEKLWKDPELCQLMGRAGREKVDREYSADRYYERLMAVYGKAIAMVNSSG
jgi:glycosyltransferase involved in cell wall biosynthesis